jgi:hypothetical protein
MTSLYRINDLAKPHLPFPLWALNRTLTPFTGWVRLDEADLLSTAMKKTGLADFGDNQFREPFRVLVGSLEHEANLSPLGRVFTRQMLLQLLITRLLVQDLLIRHPEILSLPVQSPIVITGLPRTGTTHLHNLLSCNTDLRSLPYWESFQPVLPLKQQPAPGRPDPRIKRSQQSLRFLYYIIPYIRLMHEMSCNLPHEEIQLLAVDFSTMLFEATYFIPSYRDWYRANDQTPSYRYLRKLLQVLQWLRGGTRWVLKTPQHLEHLGPLLKVFPDVKIVQTHRDPIAVIGSECTMLAYLARLYNEHIDLLTVGQYWSSRIEDLLKASIRDRPLVPEEQILDVHFHDFMSDNMAVVKQIHKFAGLQMSEDTRCAIESFIAKNPRGRLGRIEYHLEEFGLDPHKLRRGFRSYLEHFDIPDE